MADEVRKQLIPVLETLVEFTKKKEAGKIADLYTEDGILIHADSNVVGRKAIEEYIESVLPNFTGLYYEKNMYFELMNETTAMTIELFGKKDSTGKIFELIRASYLWRKVNGNWSMSRGIFNNCPLPPTPKTELQATLDERLSALYEQYKKEDYDAAIAYFTEDTTFISDGHNTVTGREALKTFLQVLIPERMPIVVDDTFYCERFNDTTAYTNSVSTSVGTDGRIKINYSNCVIWKRIDGEWLILQTLFASKPVSNK